MAVKASTTDLQKVSTDVQKEHKTILNLPIFSFINLNDVEAHGPGLLPENIFKDKLKKSKDNKDEGGKII
jgi:hypothetical protein